MTGKLSLLKPGEKLYRVSVQVIAKDHKGAIQQAKYYVDMGNVRIEELEEKK